MLRDSVVELSQSEFQIPVVLEPIPDGSMRFALDYRQQNSLTVKYTFPLPRVDETWTSSGNLSGLTI